jgi:ACS family hexuronate transporter-like MFS transporter
MPDASLPEREPRWKWQVCGLLLLATMINYMDRLTLNLMGPRLMAYFDLDPQQYGQIESAFAIAFACGALVMGWLADRVNICWLYPGAVLVWSMAGFLTGFAWGFASLLWCRFLLGLAESGNWPCALRTTQHILTPAQRTLGNGILQSGASVGAILAPPILLGLLSWTGNWRHPFWVIGAVGTLWVVLWLRVVRPADLALPPRPATAAGRWGGGLDRPTALQVRRFLALVVVVIAINSSWHIFRVWLPLFLQKRRGYTEAQTMGFFSAYYTATDAGALCAGYATLWLGRHGWGVHASRLWVYLACAGLVSLSLVAALQPAGPLLLGLLLVIGFGALGVFPCYYSFTQELTTRHQGKLTGTLGFSCWMAVALVHEVVGKYIKQTNSYEEVFQLAGLAPLVGLAALLLLWGKTPAPVAQPEPVGV